MNCNWPYIKEHIEEFPEYKSAIFEQGYLITNNKVEMGSEYPFFGLWSCEELRPGVYMYIRDNQKSFKLNTQDGTYLLIGHAFDPFMNVIDENVLLKKFADAAMGSMNKALDCLDDWTGLFLLGIFKDGEFEICSDYGAFRSTYYGNVEDRWYVASHEELVATFEELNRDPVIAELEGYRWYHLYGEDMPGNRSRYFELRKLMSNISVHYKDNKFTIERIYPRAENKMCKNEEEYQAVIADIARILRKSVELTADKWERVGLSTTGGRDSKGALAASVTLGDRIQRFSYNSQPPELVDCEAAEKLCKLANLKHDTYDIPLDKAVYPEYDLVRAILCVNSNRLFFNHNDIMKRIFFRKLKNFDVEAKSWVSEMGRAYYYKRYGVKKLQKLPKGRLINIMNNIYLMNSPLMKKIDKYYQEYIEESQYIEHLFNYEWSDIQLIETRYARWGSDVVSCEHMFAYDVTIPYNNRHLADIMMRPSLEDRIADRPHKDFTKLLCPEIGESDVHVQNVQHDNKRMWMDKIYYFITANRPF